MANNEGEKEVKKQEQTEENKSEDEPRRKSKKKFYFIVSLLVGAGVLFTVFYFIGNNKYSADQQIAAFKEAVINNQTAELQSMLTSANDSFEINEENTGILITYLNNNEDKLNELIRKFNSQADNQEENNIYASIDLIIVGKAWGLFDSYSFVVSPAYIHPMANTDKMKFQINDVDTEDISEYTQKGYGPFMPGHYNISAIFDNTFVTEEQSAEMDLYETTVEEVVHSFDFPIEEIIVDSDFNDYLLYVNGEKTDIKIHEGEQSIGDFPINGSTSINIGKDFPWGEVLSSEAIIENDEVIEFEIEHALSNEASQALMKKMNTIFATYQEAITAKDASLLEEGVTDNLKEKLADRVTEVEKKYPDYEGKLVRTIYDADYIANPEFDEKLGAYKIMMRANHVFHEPINNLGWLFRDADKDEYTRTNELTIIFNEETNEWELDDYRTSYHTIPESREIIFDIE